MISPHFTSTSSSSSLTSDKGFSNRDATMCGGLSPRTHHCQSPPEGLLSRANLGSHSLGPGSLDDRPWGICLFASTSFKGVILEKGVGEG